MTTEERSDKLLELMLRLVIAMETIATRPPSKLKSAPQHDYTEGGDEDADYTEWLKTI